MLVCEYKLELKVTDEFKAALLMASSAVHSSWISMQVTDYRRPFLGWRQIDWNNSHFLRRTWTRDFKRNNWSPVGWLCENFCIDMGFL
jgi:hypothetical protein